ncbi:folate-binding protein YgfZ [Rhodobacteraceae bacterium 2376]|uniref:Folate-binding protein YgfZ n=1 Tax=Rhabdonatronobacter sediminivivens TaxID=2743469 RepID=A0A7Z0I0D1_9RHOB|nr:folate-binding protein YgfZ [Rhabdonatronobacter sediminivivens]NYS25199.1 folate-binding protein YgfZ [Rhabdonatronobacter sediminivivens]
MGTEAAERSILRISGDNPVRFLQGLVSNDLNALDQKGLVYAALLTPQGKYLADFLVLADGPDVLLDVAAPLGADVLKRLTMYKLRTPVTLEATDLSVRRGTGPAPKGALADPRHPALGWRLYGPEGGCDGTDWEALRVAHCIPETGVELIPGESFILECGFDRLNGVDFRKGCYVGQEVTARMRHKTELRKGLTTVTVEGSAPPGTEITADGKAIGTLYTQSGGQGIAYLRFDRAARAKGPMTAAEATVGWTETADTGA